MTKIMLAKLALAAAALVVGASIAMNAVRTPETGPLAPVERMTSDPAAPGRSDVDLTSYVEIVDALSDLVNLEVTERRRLEGDVEALSQRVADLQRQLSGDPPEPDDEARVAARERAAERIEARRQAVEDARTRRFLDVGFSPERAAYLRQKQDQLAMDRLYVRDRARREGWLGTPRYREEMVALNERRDGLRQELGEEEYDRFLYAVGQPNRVTVRTVLESSPAQQSGLRPGDAILTYDGQRVFSVRELMSVTGEGRPGDATPVEIERGGERMLTYIPRGPLGVNLGPRTVRPTP